MLDFVLRCVTVTMLIIIAICQIKQAYFPVLYPDYESDKTGVEIPKDVENVDEDSPVFKMVMDAYERSKSVKMPGAFIQQIIDEPGETGVEIITDKEEVGGY